VSAFLNFDGSELSGALNPAGVGQALRVDGDGNLKVMAASSVGVPTITEDQVRAWIISGQGFTGGTGMMNSATGTNNNPLCIFNPAASGKNILIYSLSVSSGSAGASGISAFVTAVTVNPAYDTMAVVANARLGGPASAIVASCTFTTTNQTIAGTLQFVASTGPIELLANGTALLLPAGSAHGVTAFLQTYAAGISGITAKWIEF
jgi:hypothetical protein